MSDKLKYVIAGCAAGALCGFLGAGGGVALVPLLLYWIRLEPRRAFATSVFIIFPICVTTALVYLFSGSLDFKAALPYLIGGVIGGVICGRLWQKLPVVWLRRIFGALLILGGVRGFFR